MQWMQAWLEEVDIEPGMPGIIRVIAGELSLR